MKITIPENIKNYIADEKTVPLVDIKGTLWYSITDAEKASLQKFVRDLDAIPCEEFAKLSDSEKWDLSWMFNDAERILRNSVIRHD